VLTMQPVEGILNMTILKHTSILARDSASAQAGGVMVGSATMQTSWQRLENVLWCNSKARAISIAHSHLPGILFSRMSLAVQRRP